MNIKFLDGKTLPLMEEFYSVQGEGRNTGEAAYFVRIGGCDLGCKWCDEKESWDEKKHAAVATDKIIENIINCPAKSVVITGGEPLMYNLDYLCAKVQAAGVQTYIETSGSHKLSGSWDWVCLSPKIQSPPTNECLEVANEIKVIISEDNDFVWAEEILKRVNKDIPLYLQPEWSNRHEMRPKIIEYIKKHPKWRISIQVHKYMGIP